MPNTAEREVLTQEDRLASAKRTLDLDALDRIYADDLLMTGILGEPTCSKPAIMDEVRRGLAQRASALASGQQVRMSVDNEDMKVSAHGETVVTNYRFVVTCKGEHVDVHRRYRTTNVWMKRGGRWQVVAAHTALVLDPKQAAQLTGEASG